MEIDLRNYFRILLGGWKWILGLTIITFIVTFLVTSLLPNVYQATAIVAVTQPRELVQFDPRFEAVDENQPLRALPELAKSDAVLVNLLGQLPNGLNEDFNLDNLRRSLSSTAGNDPSLIHLSVEHTNPAFASELANVWATLFVETANTIYGDQSGSQVAFFEMQQEQVALELAEASNALIAFEAKNETSILNSKLEGLRRTQTAYLDNQRSIVFLRQDIDALTSYLAGSSEELVSTADQLTAVFLQIKAFGAQLPSSQFDIQLDNVESFNTLDRATQIAELTRLSDTLNTFSAKTETKIDLLIPEILSLQEQLQQIASEKEALVRDRQLVEETLIALSRKVEEEKITAQDTSSGVRLASQAAIPEQPIRPQQILAAAIASFLGFFLSIFLLALQNWWRNEVD